MQLTWQPKEFSSNPSKQLVHISLLVPQVWQLGLHSEHFPSVKK
jgi:hypothetical protein